jgi:hypothetical protein
MSVRVMTAVWDLDLPDSDKIVLLALADCANDEGHCWPSVASLVRKCSKSERTIQGCIKRLVEEELLIRREVLGKGCNYTVLPRSTAKTAPRSGGTPAGSARAQGTTGTPAAAADKPSRTITPEAKAPELRVIDAWNELPKVHKARVLDNSRKQQLRLRIKAHGMETMLEAVKLVGRSPFLRGEVGDGRRADINIILQPKTLARVLEGFYGTDEVKPELGPAERIVQLRRVLPIYERDGHHEWAAQARRMIEKLEAENPDAGRVSAMIASIAKVA